MALESVWRNVAPDCYQTLWLGLFCVLALAVLAAAVYRLRIRRMAAQFNMRLEERLNERTRIARELHDTLLQSFQGVLLKFHGISYLLPDGSEVKKSLDTTIEQARQAMVEGRDAVQGLRSSTVVTNDLARSLNILAEDFSDAHKGEVIPEWRVQVVGTTRDLPPLVRDDVYRIVSEALRNAFRNAKAKNIDVEIRYDRKNLHVRVKDDGRGIDPKILEVGGASGHYGIPGMRERAKLIRGNLTICSNPGSGTEVELTVPAAIAYTKTPAKRSTAAYAAAAS